MRYLIGTGGWSYFKVAGHRSLAAYSKVFDFVEVNSTFYRVPSLKRVELWRRTVPRDFTFAVRCNRDLSHKHRLKPVDGAFQVFAEMLGMVETSHQEAMERVKRHRQRPRQTTLGAFG